MRLLEGFKWNKLGNVDNQVRLGLLIAFSLLYVLGGSVQSDYLGVSKL